MPIAEVLHARIDRPVFVDADPDNWNLDPSRLDEAAGPAVKAVIASHLHGGVVPMSEVAAWAASEGSAPCAGAEEGAVTPASHSAEQGERFDQALMVRELMRRWQAALDDAEDWLAELATGSAHRRVLRLLDSFIRNRCAEHG
mgnify:CR=1 FL=1